MRANECFTKEFFSAGDALTDILGQGEAKDQLRAALLTKRHVIIVGPPGVGKTTLAKNVASRLEPLELAACALRCSSADEPCFECKAKPQRKRLFKGPERFIRVQGSPDLTAEDLLGDIDPLKALQHGPTSIEAFTPGKIFRANHGVLFFDEVNRCPEKLQNALLQALEERRVTIGSYDVDLPADFFFIGTMNPEDTSTEKLSDVFADRFDMIYMGYPETQQLEVDIVKRKASPAPAVIPEDLLQLAVGFVRQLRQSDKLEKKPSVRASIGLVERMSADAHLQGAKQAGIEHLQRCIRSVLAHRIRLKPSVRYLQSASAFLDQAFTDYQRELEKRLGKPGGYL